MKIFIFQGIDQVTTRYHSGGSVAIIAMDRGCVEKQINGYNEEQKQIPWRGGEGLVKLAKEDWDNVVEFELEDGKPQIFIFPDAGCCQ